MDRNNITNQTKESDIAVDPVLMPRFNSIEEIIADPYFNQFVKENIDQIIKSRCIRPIPKPGYYYKRDWYDRMTSKYYFNSYFFIENIENIWLKRSALSSEIRHVIRFVCDKSLQQTLLEYMKQVEHKTIRNTKDSNFNDKRI
jgi:hypothetical protein